MKKAISKNDKLVVQFLTDDNYIVFWSGEILTRIDRAGHVQDVWRTAGLIERNKGNTPYWRIRYKGKYLAAHRIIYQKFIGDLDPHLTINHKDGDGLNNNVENLELVTIGENTAHRFRVLGYKGVPGNSKINAQIAEQIRKDHAKGLPYSALTARYGLSKGTISMIVNGKIWKVG